MKRRELVVQGCCEKAGPSANALLVLPLTMNPIAGRAADATRAALARTETLMLMECQVVGDCKPCSSPALPPLLLMTIDGDRHLILQLEA